MQTFPPCLTLSKQAVILGVRFSGAVFSLSASCFSVESGEVF